MLQLGNAVNAVITVRASGTKVIGRVVGRSCRKPIQNATVKPSAVLGAIQTTNGQQSIRVIKNYPGAWARRCKGSDGDIGHVEVSVGHFDTRGEMSNQSAKVFVGRDVHFGIRIGDRTIATHATHQSTHIVSAGKVAQGITVPGAAAVSRCSSGGAVTDVGF